jgi:CheY-like chemotaxis protein
MFSLLKVRETFEGRDIQILNDSIDNSVAQNLLIKQLEKYQLTVTATSNGEEAVREWDKHEPGYFSESRTQGLSLRLTCSRRCTV